MSSQLFQISFVILSVLLMTFIFPDGSSGNKLRKIMQKRSAEERATLSVPESKAKEFLNDLKRPKRQLWDRSREDVQQWYQQFINMGFNEKRFEDDIEYWMNVQRSGGHDQSRYYHHYDENAPMGPHYSRSMRYGADVNYDDY
ncbi:augurin [Callorhinchus milii]|uniref:Augurin-like protein n=1 Tax=Callorhinchus milii TaxID=7868 RepID=V9L0T2_CALMI|nr:augurin [Callorhinchus milii]|eukprot:gi/632939818/ref/XP_007883257.1/ PREDICTED: augurin [Callorhinchus milii]